MSKLKNKKTKVIKASDAHLALIYSIKDMFNTYVAGIVDGQLTCNTNLSREELIKGTQEPTAQEAIKKHFLGWMEMLVELKLGDKVKCSD